MESSRVTSDGIGLRKKLAWIAALYFIQGLPLGIFRDVLPVYFRQSGVSLKEIGFMTFLTLPWSLKVFWAPLVDRFGERRTWVLVACAAMAGLMLALPAFDPAHPDAVLFAVLFCFVLASATQDIAIDAYAIGVVSKGQEGVANSFRAAFYQIAVIVGGGGTMWLVRPLGWPFIFVVLAAVFVAMALGVLFSPPVKVVHRPPREMATQFWRFVSRPGSIAVFLFVLTFRLDIMFIGSMIKPFWVDRGMTPEEIGMVSTVLGAGLTSLGAILGGLLTTRVGVFHALWSMGLAQAFPSLAYAAVAYWNLGRPWLYAASCLESFGIGLCTAAFLSFLMRICDKEQAATQYALLTALYGLTRFLGGFSGTAAEHLGYAGFFAVTFLLCAPAYCFLPWVKRWVERGGEPGAAELTERMGVAAGASPATGSAPAVAEKPAASSHGVSAA
jgi:PAT family beta-lactamase induction signal transducer AmpG